MAHRHGAGRTRKARQSTRYPMTGPGYLHHHRDLAGPDLARYRRDLSTYQDKIKEEA
ncbi:hypothetical protein [Actinomyces faecalis]|uniref:hypothetical protein n=1 Tax=Actinomyces faecalis TaxID=2722820 RepID=UPI001553D45B|nr:hypothetical protein [Actinomyces faecalis]